MPDPSVRQSETWAALQRADELLAEIQEREPPWQMSVYWTRRIREVRAEIANVAQEGSDA